MKKTNKIPALLLAAMIFVSQMPPALAATWNFDNGTAVGQSSGIFIFRQKYGEDEAGIVIMNTAANGGPVLDDEYTLLMPAETAAVMWGYEITEDTDSITLAHDKRTVVISLIDNTADVDGKTIEVYHKQMNGTTYIPYTALADLFDVDVSWDAETSSLTIVENSETPVSTAELNFREYSKLPPSSSRTSASGVMSASSGTSASGGSDAGTDNAELESTEYAFDTSLAESFSVSDAPVFYDEPNLPQAAELLVRIGILSGYEDGTLRLDNTLTRAEAATLLIKTVYSASAIADYEKNYSKEGIEEDKALSEQFDIEWVYNGFDDVALDSWYHPYVYAAKQLGYIGGYEDGNFRPSNEVSEIEFLKMTETALGYDNMIDAEGGWPDGVTTISDRLGLIENPSYEPLTRRRMAEIIYNALMTNTIVMNGYAMNQETGQIELCFGEGDILLNYPKEIYKLSGAITEVSDKTVTFVPDEDYDVMYDLLAGKEYTFLKKYSDITTGECDIYVDTDANHGFTAIYAENAAYDALYEQYLSAAANAKIHGTLPDDAGKDADSNDELAYTGTEVYAVYDDGTAYKYLDIVPLIYTGGDEDGVPMISIFEAAKALNWKFKMGETLDGLSVTCSTAGKSVTIYENSFPALMVVDGKPYVPYTSICSIFGYTSAIWNEEDNAVIFGE